MTDGWKITYLDQDLWFSFVSLQHLERKWVIPKICTVGFVGLLELRKVTGQWGFGVFDYIELPWISSKTIEANRNIPTILIIGKSGHVGIGDCNLVIEFGASLNDS